MCGLVRSRTSSSSSTSGSPLLYKLFHYLHGLYILPQLRTGAKLYIVKAEKTRIVEINWESPDNSNEPEMSPIKIMENAVVSEIIARQIIRIESFFILQTESFRNE